MRRHELSYLGVYFAYGAPDVGFEQPTPVVILDTPDIVQCYFHGVTDVVESRKQLLQILMLVQHNHLLVVGQMPANVVVVGRQEPYPTTPVPDPVGFETYVTFVWYGGLRAMVLGRLGWKPSPHPRAHALSCPPPAIYGPGLWDTSPGPRCATGPGSYGAPALSFSSEPRLSRPCSNRSVDPQHAGQTRRCLPTSRTTAPRPRRSCRPGSRPTGLAPPWRGGPLA